MSRGVLLECCVCRRYNSVVSLSYYSEQVGSKTKNTGSLSCIDLTSVYRMKPVHFSVITCIQWTGLCMDSTSNYALFNNVCIFLYSTLKYFDALGHFSAVRLACVLL